MKNSSSIKQRSFVLLLNTIASFLVFRWASGHFSPTGGIEFVWLACALSYWFLDLLSAPWFVPPRDAIISAIGSLLVLVTMDLSGVALFAGQLEQTRWYLIAFSLTIVLFAIYALFMHDRDGRSPPGRFAFRLTSVFGQGEVLFSGPAIVSIVAAYQSSFAVMSWLVLFWVLVVVGKPIERIFGATRMLIDDYKELKVQPTVGVIVRIDHPNIIRVKLSAGASWPVNRLFAASMSNGKQQYVISLFSQIQGEDVIGTGLCIAKAHEPQQFPRGLVWATHDEERTKKFLSQLSGSQDAQLVGFVVESSSIAIVKFEVAAQSNLKEGDVVSAKLSGRDVFYQIIGAETIEENFDQNPRGTHIARAAQLGVYSSEIGFSKYSWLPTMNTPLFTVKNRDFDEPVLSNDEFMIGRLPSTKIEICARMNELVEYHTAILGVTGTGKTELALDIVKEAIEQGVKVFCVDFTGEYRHRLNEMKPTFPSPTSEEASDLEQKLFAVETGEYGAKTEKKALKNGIDALRGTAEKQINTFLEQDQENLAIFELAEITNTKASLRLTELYLSMIMDWARANRRARRILIVLEEAHTIVPEVFGSGFDADTQFVVSRIGQIALQGRKYGVGLLVVSQRTALVSKTILSQCNTFLTHSLIDQTSLSFLQSVYSGHHTQLIPNLGRFEFLAFGKAIKAERPIILKREFDQNKLDASMAMNNPLNNNKNEAG